ncbi:B12-binding domain-containing radical SAM protein [Patescibacteria group bacterium]|nr:B12-binding domain-containing radical SAM protein [Patescibacteria group bacterium]
MQKKALLINPPTGIYAREDRCQNSASEQALNILRPPISLMYIASNLEKKNVKCKIVDYPVERKNWGDFKKDLNSFNPDFFIINTSTTTIDNDIKACKIAKKIRSSIVTIARGTYFSANNNDITTLKKFKYLDIIIRGETEFIMNEILEKKLENIKGITFRKENKIIKTKKRKPIIVERLPLPARHLIKNELYSRIDTDEPMAIIETARGCPYKCIYCLGPKVYGTRVRKRSVESIIKEISVCVNKFQINNFHFKSETFTINKEWVKKLCLEILKKKMNIKWACNSRVDTLNEKTILLMKQSGCWGVSFGVESGNQETLNKIKKGTTLKQVEKTISLCRKYEIKAYTFFIIGFPWENKKMINDTIKFSKKIKSDFAEFYFPHPFEGTELEMIVKEYGLYEESIKNKNPEMKPSFRTKYLSKKELIKLRNKAVISFYFRPSYIFRTLTKLKSFKELRNYIKEGLKILVRT